MILIPESECTVLPHYFDIISTPQIFFFTELSHFLSKYICFNHGLRYTGLETKTLSVVRECFQKVQCVYQRYLCTELSVAL